MMRTHQKARKIAVCAMLAALSVVLLWAACLTPAGQLGLVAAAGLLPAAALISAGGPLSGLLCYLCTSGLAFLLLPSKTVALVYVLLFGHYPVLKCFIERLHRLPLEWLFKLLLCNALFSVLYFGFRGLFLPALPSFLRAGPMLYLAGSAAFAAYDIAFSGLIALYIRRIGRHV